jgi:hypothetical protein
MKTKFKNFNHKIAIIFLEDGKMASPMSFLSIGSGKLALHIWCLHHGGSIPCDHMVSPKGLNWNTKTRYMQHTGSK